jgi:hypothetical protein
VVPGSALSVLEQDHWADTERRQLDNQVRQGMGTGEGPPVAVRAGTAVYITTRWTVYYRFDRITFGPGLPKVTEHVLGVRFLPVAHVALQAEVLVGGIDAELGETGGLRFAGTLYF